MQEEVTQKTVTFCIRATKITADLLKKVLVAYLRHQRQKSVEKKAQKNQPKQPIAMAGSSVSLMLNVTQTSLKSRIATTG